MTMYVNTANGGSLNLRESPNGATLKKIPNKTKLDVTIEGDWAKTSYDGASGYVMVSFLSSELPTVNLKSIYDDLKALLKKLEEVM